MDSEISWAFSALESCRIRCLYSSSQFIIDLILSEGVEEQEGQTEQVSVNEALAIGFLESREFQAVIDTIDGEEKDTLKSPLAEFCRNYAMYMVKADLPLLFKIIF